MSRINFSHVCADEVCFFFDGEKCKLHGKNRSDHYEVNGSVPPCKRVASLSMNMSEGKISS